MPFLPNSKACHGFDSRFEKYVGLSRLQRLKNLKPASNLKQIGTDHVIAFQFGYVALNVESTICCSLKVEMVKATLPTF